MEKAACRPAGYSGGKIATIRAGAPLPPVILMGSASNIAPLGGRRSTLARFSKAGFPAPFPVPNLTNMLVVENRIITTTNPVEPGCLSNTSMHSGDISAIGTDVYVLLQGSLPPGRVPVGGYAANLTGTTLSAPQVSGLAAYVWALKPNLTPQEVIALLQNTAISVADKPVDKSDPRCSPFNPAPVIDAYAAVLATDETVANAPVRRAVLDYTGDGKFDGDDIREVLKDFDFDKGQTVAYWLSDLNGDGRTGGSTTARFDLDVNNPPAYGQVVQMVEGNPVYFDETELTDEEVLCYYAYSPLYAGNDVAARQAAGERCGVRLEATLPAEYCPGTPLSLLVMATIPAPGGSRTARPGLQLQLNISGASPSQIQGVTDGSGRFATIVTPSTSLVTVEATAKKPSGMLTGNRATATALGRSVESCTSSPPPTTDCWGPGAVWSAFSQRSGDDKVCGASTVRIDESCVVVNEFGSVSCSVTISTTVANTKPGCTGTTTSFTSGQPSGATGANQLHCGDDGTLHFLSGSETVVEAATGLTYTIEHGASGCFPGLSTTTAADWKCCARAVGTGPSYTPAPAGSICGSGG